jgi:hypothetical protein
VQEFRYLCLATFAELPRSASKLSKCARAAGASLPSTSTIRPACAPSQTLQAVLENILLEQPWILLELNPLPRARHIVSERHTTGQLHYTKRTVFSLDQCIWSELTPTSSLWKDSSYACSGTGHLRSTMRMAISTAAALLLRVRSPRAVRLVSLMKNSHAELLAKVVRGLIIPARCLRVASQTFCAENLVGATKRPAA